MRIPLANLFSKFILGYILIQSGVIGQIHEMAITRYNASDGLSDNSIYCLLQDYQGFIWFGTRDGLHRYDGTSFKIYKVDAQDSTSIPNQNLYTIFEDSRKNLWIGSNSTLTRYNRELDNFENYPVNPDRNSVKNIIAISEDYRGRIWIVIPNQGIFMFHEPSKQILNMEEAIPNLVAPWNAIKQSVLEDGIIETEVWFNPGNFNDTLEYKYVIKQSNGVRIYESKIDPADAPNGNRILALNRIKLDLDTVRFNQARTSPKFPADPIPPGFGDTLKMRFYLDTKALEPALKGNDAIVLAGSIYPLSWTLDHGVPYYLTHVGQDMYVSTKGGGLAKIDLTTGVINKYDYQDPVTGLKTTGNLDHAFRDTSISKYS